MGVYECQYLTTPLDVEAVYSYLYRQFTSSPHYMERVQFLSLFIGSPGLRKVHVHVHHVTGHAKHVTDNKICKHVQFIHVHANNNNYNVQLCTVVRC